MNKNNISPTGIMATFANIISYLIGSYNNNEDFDIKKEFVEQINGYRSVLSKAGWNPTLLTAEEITTFGGLKMAPDKDLFLIPPWLVEFLPENFEILATAPEDDREECYVKVGEIDREQLWNADTNEYGVTRYAIRAVSESDFKSNKGLMFSEALKLITDPNKGDMIMRLPSWQPDVFIKTQWPDKNSKMTHPYLYVTSRFGRVPWKETVPEMFSCSWEVYQEDFYKELVEEMKKQKEELFKKAVQENMNMSAGGGQAVNVEQIGKDLLEGLMKPEEKNDGGECDAEIDATHPDEVDK